MQTYQNLGGNSGVIAYEIGDSHIVVEFKQGKETIYTYTNASAGNDAVETMKNLAKEGQGLNSYISTNKPGYASKR